MDSFQSIADKKKKEHSKFSKKGFDSSIKSGSRAIGGASPMSNISIQKVTELENALSGEGGLSLADRLDTLDSSSTSASQNISALDTATSILASQIATLNSEVQAVEDTLPTKADLSDIPTNVGLTSVQVQALVLQLLQDQSVISPPSATMPTILSGQYGSDFTYAEEWGDDFDDASAATLFNRWHPDLMTENLHQAGNDGFTNLRWAANYSLPADTAFIKDNALHMRAKVDESPNIRRKAYTYRGRTINPQDYHIYLSFLTTWARTYDIGLDRWVTDPNAPNRTWGPGSAFEFTVDLEEMRTQACRLSFYLLPAYENDSNSYTPDGTLGVEVDITEVDFLDGYEDYSQSKVISGSAAGNTPLGSIDLDTILADLDLPEGEHKFTFLWAKDKLVWYVNGIEIQREEDPRRIPQTPHYLVISREANSGIKGKRNDGVLFDDQDAYSDGTIQMPSDIGIWAVPVYDEIDRLHNDTARVKNFQSYSFTDTSTAGVGIGDDTSGISPTMISSNPPLVWTGLTQHEFVWNTNGRTISDWILEVGSTRGGNELGTKYGTTETSTVLQAGYAYSGPVNARLWFRESANSVWHWRDYGFSSGLQAYRTGTDGHVRVTVPSGTAVTSSVPTVAGEGATGTGTDGTFASTIDYTSGVVPSDYVAGFVEPTYGVVGEAPPIYSGTPTLSISSTTPVITYNQYPNLTGELLWPAPTSFDNTSELYEVTINGVIVFRGLANSFFVEDYPAQTSANATVRIVKNNGEFSLPLSLTFNIIEL